MTPRFDKRSTSPAPIPQIQERYGANSFGWSLLMARRLIEVGVNMVQVNLGNFGSWDLHGNNFPLLKNYLFPPTDMAVSALLDDLYASGLLESTLVVMAGEFGRTPRIFNGAPNVYKLPGRDHWAPCQSVLFAGGGVRGGNRHRLVRPQRRLPGFRSADNPRISPPPSIMLSGIPRNAAWYDATKRPYHVYHADPIKGLMA